MAHQDTGLGWSAEATWLKNTSGLMGATSKISNPAFTGQPLPWSSNIPSGSTERAAYIKANGFVVAYVESSYPNSVMYAMASEPNCYLAKNISGGTWIGLSTSNTAVIYLSSWRTTGQSNWNSSITVNNLSGSMYYNSTVRNQYYTHLYIPNSHDTGPEYIADFTISTHSWYKLNAGYAVACFAKYVNLNGDPVETPVLISSDFNSTILSNDGVTQCTFVSYSYLKDGTRFYMSMTPSSDETVSSNQVSWGDLTNFPVLVPEGVFNALASEDWAYILVTGTQNPYTDPVNEESGGGGTDPEDDRVPLEPVTFPSALGTGFCRLYCPTAAQLTNLSNYLWGPLFDLSAVKKLFADPMDSVLGLSVVPLLITGNAETVSIAGVSTDVQLNRLSAQHINVDLGSLQITEKWGAYLDYEPYTKYSIYLPFIGYRTISADDVMGEWVHLSYDIDLLSGACVAKLVSGSTLLYQWAGTCSMQIPINASNWNSVIQSTISTIGSVATSVATGGATAPLVAGALSSAATQATQMKPSIERAGGLSGAAAFLSGRRAYMIRTYPRLINPGDQPHYIGYPSFITKQLSTLAGYNVIEDIHLEGIPATQAELEEIDTLLREGVIL